MSDAPHSAEKGAQGQPPAYAYSNTPGEGLTQDERRILVSLLYDTYIEVPYNVLGRQNGL